jgi:hypothetical protein
MICPNCHFGYNPPLIMKPGYDVQDFPCGICKGTAILPDDIEYDPSRGAELKRSRPLPRPSSRSCRTVEGGD